MGSPPNDVKSNDERAAHEGLPLLVASKSSDRTVHRRSSLPLLLFGVAIILFFAHIASLQWHRTSNFLSEQNHKKDQQNNDGKQWWQSSDQVSTSYTHLSGHPAQDRDSPDHPKLRWGVLGLGRIAEDFTAALVMSGADITAVAAGSLPNATIRAKHFASRYNVSTSYGTYEGMAQDPNVDIVYIATINTLHYEPAMMMLKAGKNVLMEKPMTMKLEEAEQLAETAEEANLFLMTNYWTRFFPVIKFVRSVLSNTDRLGPLKFMRGDFGFPTPPDPTDRFLNRSSGGGAMLDLGCYLVNLAVMLREHADFPSEIQGLAQRSYLGTMYQVDTETSFQMEWDDSQSDFVEGNPLLVSGQASFRRPSTFEVELGFLHGRILIHGPANAATEATIYQHEPMGPLKHVEEVVSELPDFQDRFRTQNYPRGEGFAYIIHEIEQCMYKYGIPGQQDHGCVALKELSMEEQLLTVEIAETIMRDSGYWKWNGES